MSSLDVRIENRDSLVQGLSILPNPNVQFLPKNVNENFHSLIAYQAASCKIKSISQENFQGLYQLKSLVLHSNLIEAVEDDVFDDLTGIIYIDLSKNVELFQARFNKHFIELQTIIRSKF